MQHKTHNDEGVSVTQPTPLPTSAGPSRNRALVTIGLMLGMLITAMESTVVSTAMPTVIGDLHGIQLYPWVFSAYLLTSTTTVPIYGKMADLLGRRRVFLFATALFLVGSMLSGAAHSMPQLIAFRALQGLGAGGVLPLTLTIIGDLFTLQERARVQALFTSMWGVSSLAGPMLGAIITEQLSWRWVFYVNLPVGILSAALVGGLLREAGVRATRRRLDYAGLALLTGGVVSLLTLLLQAGNGAAWLSAPMLCLLALTVALLWAFVRQELRAADPMLPPALFRNPIILASTVGNVLIGVMMYSVDSYMPLFMQGVRGGDAHSAGLVLTPLVLCWSLSAYIGGKALVRYGFRPVATYGVASILCGAIGMALVTPSTPTAFIVATMVVLGSGLGPSSMSFLVAAQNAVSWQQRGVVTASSQFFRSMSGTVGVGALGAVLNSRLANALPTLHGVKVSANGLLNPQVRADLPPATLHQAQIALANGLHWVFVLMACIALAAFIRVIGIVGRPVVPLDEPAVATHEMPHEEEAGLLALAE
jgi:EmrB/QacA subfamily drug resistance transporter